MFTFTPVKYTLGPARRLIVSIDSDCEAEAPGNTQD